MSEVTNDSSFPTSRFGAWKFVKPWLSWLLVLWPVLTMWSLVADSAVNAPFRTDYLMVPLFEKLEQPGSLTMHDFFSAQMEHRTAWPRVVVLVLHKLWPGKYHLAQIWFSFTLICLTLLNVTMLLKKSVADLSDKIWPLAAISALVLFSPVQFGVILWPVNHLLIGLAFFLTSAIVVWQKSWPVWLRFSIATLCALCATLSLTSGFLVWIVVVPVIWFCAPMKDGKTRVIVTALWLLVFAVTAALYFHDLKNEAPPEFALGQSEGKTSTGSNLDAILANPLNLPKFALGLLGSSITRGLNLNLSDASLNVGTLMVLLYLTCAGWWLRRFSDADFRRRMLPWLAIGLYGIGTAAAISLGRMRFSSSGSMAFVTRYANHTVPLLLSLPVLLWMTGTDLKKWIPSLSAFIPRVFLVLGVAFATVQFAAWNYGAQMMGQWSSSAKRSAVNTLFYKINVPREFDPNGKGMEKWAKRADDLGLIRPPMLKSARLDNFHENPSPLNETQARWSSLHVEKTDAGLSGFGAGNAVLKKRGRVADGIFLTYFDTGDNHWEIFTVTQVNTMPFYLMDTFCRDLEFTFSPQPPELLAAVSGFQTRFDLAKLPRGICKVAAWAYDYDARAVSLIPGFFEVDTLNGTVKELPGDPHDLGAKK